MQTHRTFLSAAVVLALTVPQAFGAQVWMIGVLDQGPGKFSRCRAISEDGRWVVGVSRKDGLNWPFAWSKTGALQDIGNPGGTDADINGCGSTSSQTLIVSGNIGGLGRLYKNGAWTVLPPQPGDGVRSVYGLSHWAAAATTWVVGSSFPAENQKGYRYADSNGSYIDFWGYYQDLYGVAHNGWAVGRNNWGNGQTNPDWRYEHPIFIFDWTMNCAGGGNCGWDQLNRFAGYGDDQYYKGQATAISPSAKWAVGYLTYNPADMTLYHAFKWQVPANPQPHPTPWVNWPRPIDLGTLGAGDTVSYAFCVSDTTSNPVIGGMSFGTHRYSGGKAVYWDNAGIHDLYLVLQSAGQDMSRWASLGRVTGVSANGRLLVGSGLYDDDNDAGTPPVELGFFVDLDGNDPQPPIVTLQPVSQVGCGGGTVSFNVAATGPGTLAYQWQKDSTDLANGGHYAGVTAPTLTISTADETDSGQYRCIVTNEYGSTPSNQATLDLASAPPGTPADGVPTADAADRITWKWTDVSGENGYRVKDTTNTIRSGDLSAGTTAWQENALAANTSYTRQVAAFNACGESALSTGQTRYTLVAAPRYGGGTSTPTVSSDKGPSASGLLPSATVTFTATSGFGAGPGRVGQYGYLWDTAPGNPVSWSGEQYWTSGTLARQVGATAGTSRYLHLRAYNNASPKVVGTTVLNLGPFTVGGTGYTCLRNPGFESGFTSGVGNNWIKYTYSGSITCADETTQFHSGAHSQRISSSSSSNEGGVYQRFDAVPGQGYTISVWYKCSSTQVAAYLGVDLNGGTNPNIGVDWSSLNGTTTWTKATANVTAAGPVITVYLDAVAEGSAGSIWFDDASPACSGAPATPIDGTPTALSPTSIRWAWGDVSGETGYRVKTTAGVAVSPDLAADTGTWDETSGITANTQYSRRVYAFNASGESAGSTGQSLYSLIPAPTGVSFGTITPTSIAASPAGTLPNLAVGSSGVRTSNVTAATNSGWQTAQAAWTSTGLVPNTAYTFVARARNGNAVETADTASAVAWTLSNAPTPGGITPDRPSPCINQMVTWTAAGFGPGAVQYYRYAWGQDPNHVWTDSEAQWSSGVIATTATAGGTWYLHVRGYNGADAPNGTYDYLVTVSQSVPADFTGDCVVDLGDFAIFEGCVTGPNMPYATAMPGTCWLQPDIHGFITADFDQDGDVDQGDFGAFQRCLSGEGTQPDPNCAG